MFELQGGVKLFDKTVKLTAKIFLKRGALSGKREVKTSISGAPLRRAKIADFTIILGKIMALSYGGAIEGALVSRTAYMLS